MVQVMDDSNGQGLRVVYCGDNLDLIRAAFKIRHDVFVAEQGYDVRLEPEPKYNPMKPIMVVLDKNDCAVGCAEVWKPQKEGDPVKFGRFAVLKEARDRRIGKLLLEKIESYAGSIGAKEVYCNAQRISEYFYARNGYIGYGDEFIDGVYDGVGGMPHIKMKKSLQ